MGSPDFYTGLLRDPAIGVDHYLHSAGEEGGVWQGRTTCGEAITKGWELRLMAPAAEVRLCDACRRGTRRLTFLTDDQRAYLRGLVRMDLRKKQRSLDQFTPRPGQDPDEASAVEQKWAADVAFREATLEALRETHGQPDKGVGLFPTEQESQDG